MAVGWVEEFLPGVGVAHRYERAWARADLTAAVVLFAMLIPAGMAYAEAAGLPAVTGLYATIVPLTAYAIFGPSRVLVLGPDSSLAPMIAAAIVPLAMGDPDRAVALAGLLAVLMGAILLVGRVLRLGVVTGLLSKPIRVGYLNGIALIVLVSQLPKMLGVTTTGTTMGDNLVQTVRALTGGEVNVAALLLGVGSLATILVARALHSKVPGVLLAVVGATVVTAVAGLQGSVPVVGALPQGLPAPALDGLRLSDVVDLLPAAAGIALIAFADTAVLSRTFAARQGRTVSGNQEMVALGVANAASGLFGGFPISGSSSRTPVAVQAGARTQLACLAAAALLVGFMLALPGLPAYLPTATLAAVVVVAAASLIDVRTLVRLSRMSRTETALLLAAFAGVAFVGVLQGIAIAVGLSLLAFLRQAWNPYRTELVDVDGLPGFHDVRRHPDGERTPGLIVARFDAPLFFANGAVFGDHIRDLVAAAPGPGPVQRVIIAAEPITGVDTTAIDDLVELDDFLAARGIGLVFAEMKGPVKDRLIRYGVGRRFGPEHFYPTVNNAVRAFRREGHAEPLMDE